MLAKIRSELLPENNFMYLWFRPTWQRASLAGRSKDPPETSKPIINFLSRKFRLIIKEQHNLAI